MTALDSRRRLVLVAFLATYVVVVGTLFFMLPRVGSQVVIEILGVWFMVLVVVAIIASRIRSRTTTF